MMLFDKFVDGLPHLCRENEVCNSSFGLSLMEERSGSITAGERCYRSSCCGSPPGQRIGQLGGEYPVLLVLLFRDQGLGCTTKGQFVTSRTSLDEGKQQVGACHRPSRSRTVSPNHRRRPLQDITTTTFDAGGHRRVANLGAWLPLRTLRSTEISRSVSRPQTLVAIQTTVRRVARCGSLWPVHSGPCAGWLDWNVIEPPGGVLRYPCHPVPHRPDRPSGLEVRPTALR